MRYEHPSFPHSILTRKLEKLSEALPLFRECLAQVDAGWETLWVAHTDADHSCLYLAEYGGDECHVPFPFKEIVADTLEFHSVGLLLAHNHPSGIAQPSYSDCRATRQLASVVAALDCVVLDHLVLTESAFVSLRQIGLL